MHVYICIYIHIYRSMLFCMMLFCLHFSRDSLGDILVCVSTALSCPLIHFRSMIKMRDHRVIFVVRMHACMHACTLSFGRICARITQNSQMQSRCVETKHAYYFSSVYMYVCKLMGMCTCKEVYTHT